MTDIHALLARVAELDSAATDGPWTPQEYDHYPGDEGVPIIGGGELGSMEGHLTAYTMTLRDEAQSVADASLIAECRTAPQLARALEAVLEVHLKRYWTATMTPYCKHCKEITRGSTRWPCPTVQAITKALGVET